MAILFELESLDMRPDPEPLLVEMIHAVRSIFRSKEFRTHITHFFVTYGQNTNPY